MSNFRTISASILISFAPATALSSATITPDLFCYEAVSTGSRISASLVSTFNHQHHDASFIVSLENGKNYEFSDLKGIRYVEPASPKCGPTGNAWCEEGIRYFTKEHGFKIKFKDSGAVLFWLGAKEFRAQLATCEE